MVLENACMREVGLHTLVDCVQPAEMLLPFAAALTCLSVSSKHIELCRQANLFVLKHNMHAVGHRDGGGGGSGAAGPCISVKT